MVFWVAILVGALFVWLAVRMGFYETWVLLFNVIISMYIAIFLAPIVSELAPAPGGAASYSTALSMALLAGGCFAVLHGLSYVFLTGQFSIPFPRMLDIVFSGILGFVAGFLVLSFLALVLATTPLADNSIVAGIGLGGPSQQTNISCIARCCDLIHSFTGPGDQTTLAAVRQLLDPAGRRPREDDSADVNEPVLLRRPDAPPQEGDPRRDTSRLGTQPAGKNSARPSRRTIPDAFPE
jgi:hypothetical protein